MLLDEKAAMHGLVEDLKTDIDIIVKFKETMIRIFSNRLRISSSAIKMEEINSLLNDLYIYYAKQQIALDKMRHTDDQSHF